MSKRTGLIGTKIGNSSFYDDSGKSLPVTILKIDECIVSDVKTIEKNGYSSVQLVSIDGKKEIKKLKNTEHIHFYSFYIGNYPELDFKSIEKIVKTLNKSVLWKF